MTSGAVMAVCAFRLNLAFIPTMPPDARRSSVYFRGLVRPLCASASLQQDVVEAEGDAGIMCDPCGGKGWLLCDFCNGQKTNVKSTSNRIYRRCPSCKAVGCILCPKCKVFKCLTFPNYADGLD